VSGTAPLTDAWTAFTDPAWATPAAVAALACLVLTVITIVVGSVTPRARAVTLTLTVAGILALGGLLAWTTSCERRDQVALEAAVATYLATGHDLTATRPMRVDDADATITVSALGSTGDRHTVTIEFPTPVSPLVPGTDLPEPRVEVTVD
jgi:hypothetical protein